MVDLLHLVLAREFPSREAASFEIAALKAQLEMPKGVVHVISDIHGEARKLRHVINNASGMLRPVVAELFEGELEGEELKQFLHLLYYPTESLQVKGDSFGEDEQQRYEWVLETLRRQFVVIRHLIHHDLQPIDMIPNVHTFLVHPIPMPCLDRIFLQNR